MMILFTKTVNAWVSIKWYRVATYYLTCISRWNSLGNDFNEDIRHSTLYKELYSQEYVRKLQDG